MRNFELRMPATYLVSLLAALTTWLTLLSWSSFAEHASSYLVPLLGLALIVATSGMLLRSARAPALLVVLAQVVIVLVWLHHRLAGSSAIAGLIPTGDSVRAFARALQASVNAAQTYAAPVPQSVPQFAPLMILAGAGTLVLVDLLACGLRRAPLAGLPLLAVYTAPVSILDGGVSWLKFTAAALSFLFLLAANEAQRLSSWGHQLSGSDRVFDTQSTSVSNAAVWASARKIGFTATGLAVIVPLFVPTLTTNLFSGNGSGGNGHGNAVSISNPMVDLKRDLSEGRDVELLRFKTKDPNPAYLRISVLDSFDGLAWRPSGRNIPVTQRADGRVTLPPGLDSTVSIPRTTWSISVDNDFRSRWLPAPYPVYSINAPGDWRYDQSTLDFVSAADEQTTANISYTLKALAVQPTSAQLANAGPAPASIFAPYTALPKSVPASLRALAKKVTRDSTNAFVDAVRLQRWFRVGGGFTYSLLRAPGNGVNDLERFLSTGPGGRTGYCEQFAAAMALMARTLGIPARVAVGFLRPDRIGAHTYAYSAHDLHAWPELYFEGTGWVRFEPTPASHTGSAPAYASYTVTPSSSTPSASSAPTASHSNRLDRTPGTPTSGTSGGGGSSGGGPGILYGLLGLLALIAVLLLPRSVRVLVRRRRWTGAASPIALAEAAWAELRDSALDLGLVWDDSVTLRTRARDLVRSFGKPHDDALGRSASRGPRANPEAAQALDRIVRLVERARFARALPTEADLDGLRTQLLSDVGVCVDAIRAAASAQRRTWAAWLPASLVYGFSVAGPRRGTARIDVGEAGIDHAV